ncbi:MULTISPECIES: hypothetical protein [Streptomycetaceae]|uniref:Secreted protein n=1 Tax=Streptantibioticus cattleyicolor (strain ATCC 35852 / DSM 46488 / JCM 4925 / NBRC 14057 / NRRL 8057) TaxID=1003195 RepID=F8JR66_STREN|nr:MULTISPECIES: hypothetical protein [Streptomycetaceae]AEW95363.1 hypothetical protein SCATT_29920 [Streptantibioticus cattleyicolor NRRL 8057 = DSM 46488]MYS59937.1 hypothetical protein [Streptomyces sp. SID5468]CCB75706.1 Secreted protein [Streptantibioticus cattleyicolor NRRL 8057 = DSM 46488]
MSSIRTARALAALAALPLAAALFTGVASADDGAFADHSAAASVSSIAQSASGRGAGNQANTATVLGNGYTRVAQNNVNVDFGGWW